MRIDIPSDQQHNPIGFVSDNYAQNVVKAGMDFSQAVYQHSKISLREFEAARARTAEINGCLVCQNFRAKRDLPGFFDDVGGSIESSVASRGDAPDDEFYENVSHWKDYPGYTERERLAIEYAEAMGTAPKNLSQDEDFWKRFKAAYSDAEIVDLTYAIASWIGMGRAAHVLGMDQQCGWLAE